MSAKADQPRRIDGRSVVMIAGPEATHFLQNLITCDIESLQDEQSTFGALLSPQGKILFDFHVYRMADGFAFDIADAFAADFIRRMAFYRLRADVTITPSELQVIEGTGNPDVRHADMGLRGIGEASDDLAVAENHTARRISLCLPELGADYETGTTFPHEALMDQYALGGVDFTKGCYVGQEVVSRMQHRGTARSRFVSVTSPDALPPMGTEIRAGERAIGTMGSSSGKQGLALVRLDRAAKAMAEGIDITADGAGLSFALPDFATFGWPE